MQTLRIPTLPIRPIPVPPPPTPEEQFLAAMRALGVRPLTPDPRG